MSNSGTIPKNDLVEFGKIVKKARNDAELTQQNLADDLYSQKDRHTYISAIENGRKKISSKVAKKICQALGICREQIPYSLRWTDPIPRDTELHPSIGQRLEKRIPKTSSFEERRKAVGGKVTWEKLLEGAYMPREQHLNAVYEAFSEWQNNVVSACAAGKIPLFWIGGRSGDGKSTLLLQLVQKILNINRRLNIFQASSGNKISEIIQHNNLIYINKKEIPIIVVDDLHLSDAMSGYFENIKYHDIIILACGPTPEFKSFKHKYKNIFESDLYEISSQSSKERNSLAEWFDVAPQIENLYSNQILVETLFEFAIGETIEDFADKFKQRLKNRNFYEATKSALSLNLFDMLAPLQLAESQNATLSLEDMSNKNHLHFEKGKQFEIEGFRLIHGKIAWRLFQRWVTDEYENSNTLHCLAESIALALNHVDTDNHLFINTLINTAESRIISFFPDSEENENPSVLFKFITFLEQSTRSVAHINALVVRTALQHTPKDYPKGNEIISKALVARDNNKLTVRMRLSVAAILARPHHSIIPDQRKLHAAALKNMLEDDEFWPVAMTGIMALLFHKDYRTQATDLGLKWTRQYPYALGSGQFLARLINEDLKNLNIIEVAYEWINAVGKVGKTASVLGALVSNDVNSVRAKDVAIDFVKNKVPEPWHQHIICALLNKHVDDREINHFSKEWLDKCNWQKGSESVLSTLIAKGNDKDRNIAFALQWIKGAGSRPGLENVFRSLVKASEGQSDVIDATLAWVRSSNNLLNAAGVIGVLLKHSNKHIEVIQETEKWLDEFGLKHRAMEVLKAYIPASAGSENAVARSLSWMETNLSYNSSEQVIRTLLANTQGRQDVIDMWHRWLVQHPPKNSA